MARKKEILMIDFEKGILYRLKTNGLIREVGTDKDGYLQFRLDGKMIYVHRYLYEQYHNIKLTSDVQIDHINRNKIDNRIENLRISTPSHNCQNRDIRSNNTSGYKGVSYNIQNKKWMAYIGINGKQKHLGYFTTAEEAYEAYKNKAKELNSQGYKYYFEEKLFL